MRSTHLLLVGAIAISALGGCSFVTDFDDFEIGHDAGPPPLTADTFVDALALKVCNRARQCGGHSAQEAIQESACGHIPGVPGAISLFEIFVERFAPRASANFDETKAEACLAAISSTACSTDALPRECAYLRAGTKANAAACNVDSDCASGRCAGTPSACGARACADLGAASQACDETIDCAAGLHCANAMCVAPKAANAACTVDAECQDGLWCDDRDGSGACAARPAVDSAPCAVHSGVDPCMFGLYCINGACLRGADADSSCDATHPCEPGTRCVANACRTIGTQGDACVTRNDCAGFFDCVGSKCAPSPVVGETCDANRPCAVGACSGTCQIPQPGSTCLTSTLPFVPVCNGFCNNGFTPARCDARKGDGQGCTADDQCTSGACVGSGSATCMTCP